MTAGTVGQQALRSPYSGTSLDLEFPPIHRQCVARLRAGDQIVEVAIGVAGPNLLDDHGRRHPGGGVIELQLM